MSHIKHGSTRLYTIVLSETEENIKYCQEIFKLYDYYIEKKGSHPNMNVYYEKTSQIIPFVIKKFKSKQNFSHFICDTDKLIPSFSITGPYGLGLGLSAELTGHHYIFAAGTGILPFCDFLFFLLRFMTYNEIINHIGIEGKNSDIINKNEQIAIHILV